MTALARKQRSEERLLLFGINLNDQLPPIEEEYQISLKAPKEIAQRILVLTYLSCIAFDPSLRQEVMRFLIHDKLWEAASEEEKILFHKSPLDETDITKIMWRTESLATLLWTIGKIETMEAPDQETDLHSIFPMLPGFFESTEKFIESAEVRAIGQILDEFDFAFRASWAMRDFAPESMNPGILHERYYSLEWVTNTRDGWD